MEAIGGFPPITTLDLQLYIIAQEIRFANWEELGHHIIRLGGFHVHEQVWKILGKKYAASGLEDILVEANVFGPNSASVIMKGGNYKRCTLAHSLMYETICRLEWKSFLEWMVEKEFMGSNAASQLEEMCKSMQHTMKEFLQQEEKSNEKQTAITSALAELNMYANDLEDKYKQFLVEGKAQSKTFHFWHEYLNDVELSLNYIKAERIPDWQLHLACCADIISYAFAYYHQNYARWGPVYLAEMLLLPETAPEVHAMYEIVFCYLSQENMWFVDLGLDHSIMFGQTLD